MNKGLYSEASLFHVCLWSFNSDSAFVGGVGFKTVKQISHTNTHTYAHTQRQWAGVRKRHVSVGVVRNSSGEPQPTSPTHPWWRTSGGWGRSELGSGLRQFSLITEQICPENGGSQFRMNLWNVNRNRKSSSANLLLLKIHESSVD